jgi:hypothetical protein
MTNVWNEREAEANVTLTTPEANRLELAAYVDEDDGVTRMLELPQAEPSWIVQVTPFDRRIMETSRLLAELRQGMVQRGTLVWRGGMHDWLPVERIGELLLGPALGRAAPAPRRVAGAGLAPSAWVALLLLAAAATTVLLAAGGVFG